MSRIKFLLSGVEHEKSCITLRPVFLYFVNFRACNLKLEQLYAFKDVYLMYERRRIMNENKNGC